MKYFLIIFLIILMDSYLFANNNQDLKFQNICQQSMGGAGIAIFDHASAIYTNPASLVNSNFKFHFPRLGFSFNNDFIEKRSEFEKLLDTDVDESEQAEALKNLVPLKASTFAYLTPLAISYNGFAIGVFENANIYAGLKRKTNPILEVKGCFDIIPTLAYAREIQISNFTYYIGFSAKYIFRTILYDKTTESLDLTLTQSDIINYINDNEEKKEPDQISLKGFGMDIGLLFPIGSKEMNKGHWGIVINNIGSNLNGEYEIDSEGKHQLSQKIPTTATIGISYNAGFLLKRIPVFNKGKFLVAADYQFISPSRNFFRNLYLGLEKSVIFDIIKLRAGIHQGYIVGGVGLDLFILDINYACTSREQGATIGSNPIKYHIIDVGFSF